VHNLTVVVSSTRPQRAGAVVAEWFAGVAECHRSFDVHVADLREIDLPLLDEPEEPRLHHYRGAHTMRWSALIDAAEAVVFVMPEYNHGYSAPLKNAIDFLGDEWEYKPVGFVCYGMTSGGLRAVHSIRPVVSALRMLPAADLVSVPLRRMLDGDGVLHPDAAMTEGALSLLDELARLVQASAVMRLLRDGEDGVDAARRATSTVHAPAAG
jgi:NAD(P)H-dependent FMN reductase